MGCSAAYRSARRARHRVRVDPGGDADKAVEVVGGGALKVKVDSTPRLGLLVTNEGLRSWEIIAQSLFCVVGSSAARVKL